MSYFIYKDKNIFYQVNGAGSPLVLLHGNTASSQMFKAVVDLFTEKHTVITMDFLGCGRSDRLSQWPDDLWYEWSEQVAALCCYKDLSNVDIIGCSGGAMAAINMALEHPESVHAVVADSFEGIEADASVTEQIRKGRNYAKQNEQFVSMLKAMHGDDWEEVLDADTNAIIHHAERIGSFFHKTFDKLQTNLLLTGSAEDEMFPQGHYEKLFSDICSQTNLADSHIFEHGRHPAMISNIEEFVALCENFFTKK